MRVGAEVRREQLESIDRFTRQFRESTTLDNEIVGFQTLTGLSLNALFFSGVEGGKGRQRRWRQQAKRKTGHAM